MAEFREYAWKAFDGLNLYGCSWSPVKGEPSAVINLVHGLGEHSGRYREWAEQFAAEGYAVISLDYRGHGRSEGRRGHAGSLEDILKDIDVLTSESESIFPGKRRVLYGHSLGGTLVLNYVLSRKKGTDALIVTSPFLKHATEPASFTLLMGRIFRSIWPSFQMSNGLHSSDLSHNADVASLYREDPLVHNKITPGLYFAMREGGAYVLGTEKKIQIPMLLMHGSGDKITSYQASQELAGKNPDHVTFRLWQDLFHELHHEPAAQDIFRYMIQWLKENDKSSPAGNGYF